MRFIRRNWRQILLILALGLFAWLVVSHRHELKQMEGIVLGTNPAYLILALLAQFIFYVLQALMFSQIISLWGTLSFRDIFIFTLASNSFNKIIPSGGLSGLLVFSSHAKDKGIPPGLSLCFNAIFYLFDYLSFLVIVWWGFYTFNHTINLGWAGDSVVVFFTLVIVVLSIAAVLAFTNPGIPEKFLQCLAERLPVLKARLLLWTGQWQESGQLLLTGRNRLWRVLGLTFLLGLAMQLCDVLILWLCCASLGSWLSLPKVVAAFGLSSVIALGSMVPQGIGIYESSLTWLLHQMQVPFALAFTIALLYRGVTYWFAMLPGLVAVGRKGGKR